MSCSVQKYWELFYLFYFLLLPSLSLNPDVVTIDKTGENFRLLYDVKGRFTVHRIMTEEAKVSH